MENALKTKSYLFSIKIIDLYKFLKTEKSEYILSKQILRSWTSIWAMIREWEYAQSKLDFINKMNIALKETNETLYWLELLKDTKYIDIKLYNLMNNNCEELLKILIATVKTSKNNV